MLDVTCVAKPNRRAVNGRSPGRAGMMGTIPSDVRSGLLELFYGVYEKDPDRCACPGLWS